MSRLSDLLAGVATAAAVPAGASLVARAVDAASASSPTLQPQNRLPDKALVGSFAVPGAVALGVGVWRRRTPVGKGLVVGGVATLALSYVLYDFLTNFTFEKPGPAGSAPDPSAVQKLLALVGL